MTSSRGPGTQDADGRPWDTVIIPRRYNGPADTANGGVACGLIAAGASRLLRAPIGTVNLLEPPRLEQPLSLVAASGRAQVFDGKDLVAVANRVSGLSDPAPRPRDDLAEGSFPGDTFHPFPRCYVCGTGRPDGLGLRPTTNPARPDTTACDWRPTDQELGPDGRSVAVEMIWAVLDCPGGWTFDLRRQARVLARQSVIVLAPVPAGRLYTIVGRLRDRNRGRVGTAMYDQSGAVLAFSEATWLPWTGPVEP